MTWPYLCACVGLVAAGLGVAGVGAYYAPRDPHGATLPCVLIVTGLTLGACGVMAFLDALRPF